MKAKPTDHIDGKAIAQVRPVPLQTNDADQLCDAVIVGRGAIDMEGGGIYHGLVIKQLESIERCIEAVYYVVVWERATSRFVAVPVEYP